MLRFEHISVLRLVQNHCFGTIKIANLCREIAKEIKSNLNCVTSIHVSLKYCGLKLKGKVDKFCVLVRF